MNKYVKLSIVSGALLGLLAVSFGAFGSHLLKERLETAGYLDTYNIAVRYQFYHALALLFCGLIQLNQTHFLFKLASIGFILGAVLFSGSLYILCLTSIKSLGIITPVGGILLISAWLLMLIGGIKKL